jgi:UDP-glucose 4-epimerase
VRVFVTGAAGYVGSALAARLLSDDGVEAVVGLDDESRGDFTHLRQYAGETGTQDKLTLLKKDFLDFDYDDLLSSSDVLVHLASVVGERGCEQDKGRACDVNVKGLMQLLDRLEGREIRFIFTSSQVVYGKTNEVPFNETQEKRPDNIYSITKACGEDIIRYYSTGEPGLKHIIFRLASVYGFGLYARWGSLTGKFTRLAAEGQPLPIYGGGGQRADFVHVRDVADAIVTAIHTPEGGAWDQTYNVASGQSISILELGQAFIDAARIKSGVEVELIHEDTGRKEIAQRWLDIGKVRQGLGWEPKITFNEGVSDLLEKWSQKGRNQST